MTVPLESFEQTNLSDRLDIKWYVFSAIRNESDYHDPIKWAKRKKEWVRKWISDFCIILKRKSVLFIELKRQRSYLKSWKRWASPSKVTNEQLNWFSNINDCENVGCTIAYWANEAIKAIEEYEVI